MFGGAPLGQDLFGGEEASLPTSLPNVVYVVTAMSVVRPRVVMVPSGASFAPRLRGVMARSLLTALCMVVLSCGSWPAVMRYATVDSAYEQWLVGQGVVLAAAPAPQFIVRVPTPTVTALVPPAPTCSSNCYYIDPTGGLDTRTSAQAKSKSTPWAHLPCMATATSNAAAYAPAAGDIFVLKGGETWTRTNFPCTWSGSGSAGNVITVTADGTWFSGGSWSRPKFTAGSVIINATNNMFLNLQAGDWLTVSWIEFDGFKATSWAVSNTCAMIQAEALQNLTVDKIYVHNFSIDATSDTNCYAVKGATFGTFNGASVVQNSVFIGDGTSYGSMISYFGNAKNNVIHDTIGMIFPMGHGEISGNLMYNCGYPSFPAGASSVHGDAIQVDGADGTFYIHDNVIHDTGGTGSGESTNECEAGLIGNPGETDYVWNNVTYNLFGNAWAVIQNASPGNAVYFWNNTVEALNTDFCFRQGHVGTTPTVEVRNNHCISPAAAVQNLTATSSTVDHNTLQTSAAASTQGYTHSQAPYVFFPTAGSPRDTVGAGADLTANCSGSNAGLCSDTGYGALLNSGNVATYPVRTIKARPSGSAWDSGAYLR